MDSNFFLQDTVGITLAFLLFSFIFVFPGYVIGWSFNLLKQRTQPIMAQLAVGIFISASVIPAILFLIYRLTSAKFGIGVLFAFAIAAIYVYLAQNKATSLSPMPAAEKRYQTSVLGLFFVWILFSVFVSADLQIGKHLYFSNNSYDMLTRVSVVDAMTRTGVPPVNPSYYPGYEVRLNFLYYFWYILASAVDQIGGTIVSAYHAMIASISWCGIVLFSAASVYLRVRSSTESTWKQTFVATQLFAIGGLDFVMLILLAIKIGFLPANGQMEGWNMPIMSWLNAITWVPHHVIAAIACMFALLLLIYGETDRLSSKVTSAVLIGLAFASAFGLSVWVMFVFGIFWGVWAIFMLLQQRGYTHFLLIVSSGVLALLFVSPFIVGLFIPAGEKSIAQSHSPVSLYVRPFMIVDAVFSEGASPLALNIMNLLVLPLNYLFELGFFFFMATLWIQDFYKKHRESGTIYKAELVLVIVTTITLSFLYSTLISINDLGIRGWLPMQFILVIWSTDVIMQIIGAKKWVTPGVFSGVSNQKKVGMVLGILLITGLLTSALEAVSLRMWSIFIDMNLVDTPNQISKDTQLGARTYDARLAYEFIGEHTALDVIVQYNPVDNFDRPSGLYGTRQMIISDRTSYGVPLHVYEDFVERIGSIFEEEATNWDLIDLKCQEYFIEILIVKDTDPLWGSLSVLRKERTPLYENDHYALYSCGR